MMSLWRNGIPFPVPCPNQTVVTLSETKDFNRPMIVTKDSGCRFPARVQA
jgi:hypothetical protein